MKATIAAIVAVLLATDALACGPSDICADAVSTLVGTVISDGFAPGPSVELDWSTSSEMQAPQAPSAPLSASSANSSATPYTYRVSRCSSTTACEWIATVRAVGGCGVAQPYTVVDRSEPAPIYRLELLEPDGRVACSVDVAPEPPSAPHPL